MHIVLKPCIATFGAYFYLVVRPEKLGVTSAKLSRITQKKLHEKIARQFGIYFDV